LKPVTLSPLDSTLFLDEHLQVAALQHVRLDLIRDLICGHALKDLTYKTGAKQLSNLVARPYEPEKRLEGSGWPVLAVSMAGCKRLDNIRALITAIQQREIPGDFLEAGVWRGGVSIFARSVFDVLGNSNRKVYVADSFEGLPKSQNVHDTDSWSEMEYLSVSMQDVRENFKKFGALHNVEFVKGYFHESLPKLRQRDMSLCLLRLDGDMYQSTADGLYNLYDKVQIGGYVIIDDWAIGNARKAVKDFWNLHGVVEEIIPIDHGAVYFEITRTVERIKYEHYLKFATQTSTKNNKLLMKASPKNIQNANWMAKCKKYPYPCLDEFE
jgi:hypothetical protein